MTIKLSELGGGGGVFVASFISNYSVISSGASGILLTLTPPAGERVKLEYLRRASTGNESNIEVRVGGVAIKTGTLSDGNGTPPTTEFMVGPHKQASTTGNIFSRVPIIGGNDEVIEVEKTSGSIGSDIEYAYHFGEIK